MPSAVTKRLCLPANLDIPKFLHDLAHFGEKIAEGGLCFLSYVVQAGSYGDHVIDDGFGRNWRQVHSDIPRSFLTDDYVAVLDCMIARGYIERMDADPETGEYFADGFYLRPIASLKGRESQAKQFRIHAQQLGSDKKYKVLNVTLGQRELNKFVGIENRVTYVNEKYRNLVRESMKKIVLLDTAESRAAIKKLYEENKVRVTPEIFLDVFNNQPFKEVQVDRFGYRVHSQMVTVPKLLREFLRFDFDMVTSLVEIDLVNSQPAIFASITPALIKRFAPECKGAIPLFKAVEKDANWQLFQQLCFDTTIYETLQDAYNKAYQHKMLKKLTRDEAKLIFYLAAFGDYDYLETENVGHLEGLINEGILFGENDEVIDKLKKRIFAAQAYIMFKKLFPTVHQLFYELKALKWDFNPGISYSNNCLLAQRIESGLVYTTLVKATHEAGIEVVTIHDSLLVRQEDEVRVRTIVQRELAKLKLKLRLKKKA
ncbi:hypothetical protein MTX78_24950 (plasmid) [Hymenobacter tibetensis]|uniref:DNA-directed DNA polymerase family A palm domain-containing protein n=1 Tax=Hymenobacter tibetensis TaxID=497967 RepID=A0ABY4D5D1_9BACT|nr:hypothetical protein [Hymenobacter tibetensis]UOG77660.1 hypothetical protein MTX78_24950 [Hymenobacter tibetensis]